MAGAACTPSTWVTCSRKCSTCSAPIRACGGEARAMSAVIKPGGAAAREQAIRALLAEVADPEIPVLSIVDLGIVRHVRFEADGRLHVAITPTYSGCPATEVIRTAVRTALDAAGYADAVLEEGLSPPWTSAWGTSAACAQLKAFGIAPPQEPVSSPRRPWNAPLLPCP